MWVKAGEVKEQRGRGCLRCKNRTIIEDGKGRVGVRKGQKREDDKRK